MNYFKALADQQMVAATKAKHRTAEKRQVKVVKSEKDAPMKLSDMEQKQADQSTQLRAWRAWHRARIEAIKNGPLANNWLELEHAIKALTIENPQALVDYVRSASWLRNADLTIRQSALSMIASAIIRLRLSNGYSPIDDSIPGEEPTVFEIVRTELRTET